MTTFRHFFDRYNDLWEKDGGFTMAVDWDRKVVGFAFCSPKDQYCKKTGRDLAAKRIDIMPGPIAKHGDSIIVVTMPRAGNRATKAIQRTAIFESIKFINKHFPNTPFGFTFEK